MTPAWWAICTIWMFFCEICPPGTRPRQGNDKPTTDNQMNHPGTDPREVPNKKANKKAPLPMKDRRMNGQGTDHQAPRQGADNQADHPPGNDFWRNCNSPPTAMNRDPMGQSSPFGTRRANLSMSLECLNTSFFQSREWHRNLNFGMTRPGAWELFAVPTAR